MVLDWPQRRNGVGGKPITTALNQAILKAAAQSLTSELPNETQSFCNAIDKCITSQQWRKDYIVLMEQFVRLQAKASPQGIIQSCSAGLDFATKSFVIRNNNDNNNNNNDDDVTTSIEQAFANINHPTPKMLSSETLTGAIPYDNESMNHHQHHPFQLASPHGTDNNPIWISGDDAIAQINVWKEYGCMEPSAANHAIATCSSNNISDFVTGKTFCLLGITSEMGPTTHLLKISGAHVMGVARSGPKLDALKQWFHDNGPVGTTLQLCSADLLNDTVAIARWIIDTAPSDQQLVIMPLAYMDGEANVRVTVAMDAILTHVIHIRNELNISLVYLTSPTTIYTIPKEAALDAKRRYETQRSSLSNQLLSMASFGNWLQPSNTWTDLDLDRDQDSDTENSSSMDPIIIYNGAYHLQGPNYCLAKLMQQWRCMVAAANSNTTSRIVSVFAPHAPGTRTWSVRHNSSAAIAMEGLQYFPPMLTFDVQPCSSLLTAIILHQLYTAEEQRQNLQKHPMELFWDGAVHGGGWRCPYRSDSIVALTYLFGKTWAKSGYCPPTSLAAHPKTASSNK